MPAIKIEKDYTFDPTYPHILFWIGFDLEERTKLFRVTGWDGDWDHKAKSYDDDFALYIDDKELCSIESVAEALGWELNIEEKE